MCGHVLFLKLVEFLYEANVVCISCIKDNTAASLCSRDSGGGVRGEERNEGQTVSSTGLCSALQRKNPAAFDKHNFDCNSELSEDTPDPPPRWVQMGSKFDAVL